MRLEIDIAEHHYNNIMALDSVSLGRVPYKGIIMYSINAIKHGKVLEGESTTKNNLGVKEVTAMAEWISKLTEECEVAYNKGYADGMKAQAEPKTKIEESNFSREQYVLDIDTAWKCGYEAGKKENSPINICPHCGEYIGEEEEQEK